MPNLSDLIPPRLGTSGYSGYSSSSGTSGYSGHSGYSAYSGYSGYSGKSGYSAYSGTSWSGYSAYSGSSGTSAYSGVAGAATGNLDVTVTAGEALSARDFVYVAPVTGGGLTAGRAYKADADTVRASTQGFYFGFVVANISAAATGTVRLMGSMAGFTVTAGAPQYLSTTAGAITETGVVATGGTISYSGGYTIHTFTTDGTFTVLRPGTVEYLVVAGGGGGGKDAGAGGGAGGVRDGTGFAVTPQAYTITVGGGGNGATSAGRGTTGSNSVFSTITSNGGGGGGAYANPTGTSGYDGGSGGGGGGGTTNGGSAGSGNTPSTTPSQGNNGSAGSGSGSSGTGAGAGGGAGAAGGASTTTVGGIGGIGVQSSISGTATYYGGGGGGNSKSGSAQEGGLGGGGKGGVRDVIAGTAGTANRGGGGGGSDYAYSGGNGGSGIVIIRYLTTNSLMVGIALDSSTILINCMGENTTLITSPPASGYWAGGLDAGVSRLDSIEKTTFETDTTSTIDAVLTAASTNPAGCGGSSNGSSNGYVSGGNTGAVSDKTSKFVFSTEVCSAATTANLSIVRTEHAGLSERSTKCYFSGGDSGGAVFQVRTDKITFSNDTGASTTTANISLARTALAGANGGSSKGYFAGGQTGLVVKAATADKLTFSTDVTGASTSSNLTVARYWLAALSEGTTKCYFSGGHTGSAVVTTDKVTFSTDVTGAATTANLTSARSRLAGIGSYEKGFFCYGHSATPVDVTDKITFSSDTASAQSSANLSASRRAMAGFGSTGL